MFNKDQIWQMQEEKRGSGGGAPSKGPTEAPPSWGGGAPSKGPTEALAWGWFVGNVLSYS